MVTNQTVEKSNDGFQVMGNKHNNGKNGNAKGGSKAGLSYNTDQRLK